MISDKTRMSLKGDETIVIERLFAATPETVFRAWTDPALVRLWWAPRKLGAEMVLCEADLRPGGRYRYVLRHRDGQEIGFAGTYRALTAPAEIVYTQALEGMEAAGEAVITVTLLAEGAGTLLRSEEVYPSAQIRDMVLASGMEVGMRDTMNQLADLVERAPA